MFLFIWSMGCGNQSNDWASDFQSDPKGVHERLLTISDPVERLQIVNNIQAQFPGQIGELCTVLDSTAQNYCLEKEKRPHLWMPLKENESLDKTAAFVDPSCPDVSCRIALALPQAYRGAVSKVRESCTGPMLSDTHECLFMTAEKMVDERGVTKYDTAAEICRLAESFHENCQNHLIQQLAKHAPDADSVSDWGVIFAAHNAIETTWGWRDTDLQTRLQSRLWSEALGVSFAGADQIVGNVLDVVPKKYVPHVYSAAAWRMFQMEEPQLHNLSEWATILEQRLEHRTQKSASLDQQRRFRSASQIGELVDAEWSSDLYLSTASRWYDPRPNVDMTISILEAIARKPPVHVSLLEEGLSHSEPIVHATATRLQQVVVIEQP